LPILTSAKKQVVLVVDDVRANRELLEGHLFDLGYEVRQAVDGIDALEQIEAEEPDLVLLDVDMPRLNGLDLCRRIKSHPARRLIPIVILTALQDRNTRLRGLEAGADDFLTKPFDARELLVRARVLLRDRELNLKLDATETVLRAIAQAVEARDRYTIHHAERVGRYAREVGVQYGLEGEDLDILYMGGVLHDVGKMVVPDAILHKPGPLTEEEQAVMRRHSAAGERICASLRSVSYFLPLIRHHHERYDGQGYPDHRQGADIPMGARIVAVADGWDAMVSDRPYRPGLDREEALRRLRAGAGTQWDPAYVDLFAGLLERGTIDQIAAAQYGEAALPA
jgi:putative two-component system response regulator